MGFLNKIKQSDSSKILEMRYLNDALKLRFQRLYV